MLWEALGSFGEALKAFLLLAPSLPPLYIKKNRTPDQPLQRPHITNTITNTNDNTKTNNNTNTNTNTSAPYISLYC